MAWYLEVRESAVEQAQHNSPIYQKDFADECLAKTFWIKGRALATVVKKIVGFNVPLLFEIDDNRIYMEHVRYENTLAELWQSKDERVEQIAFKCGELLAAIHGSNILDTSEYSGLSNNIPIKMIHADFGIGNLLMQDNGQICILDWASPSWQKIMTQHLRGTDTDFLTFVISVIDSLPWRTHAIKYMNQTILRFYEGYKSVSSNNAISIGTLFVLYLNILIFRKNRIRTLIRAPYYLSFFVRLYSDLREYR